MLFNSVQVLVSARNAMVFLEGIGGRGGSADFANLFFWV